MRTKEEIPQKELLRYATELRQLIDVLCSSAAFKTSPKSCQFLRYIVENTLDGNVEVLKERLIGITLLGRSTSYDTAADAGVRVRANDVRRRLAAYAEREAQDMGQEFSIEVPPGAYMPHFSRWVIPTQDEPEPASGKMQEVAQDQKPPHALAEAPQLAIVPANQLPRLSFYWLSGPTIAALFLCTIFMRWQMNEEHPTSAVRHHDFLSRPGPLSLPARLSPALQRPTAPTATSAFPTAHAGVPDLPQTKLSAPPTTTSP